MLRISGLVEVGRGGIFPLKLNLGSNKNDLPDLCTLSSEKEDWPPSWCRRYGEVNILTLTADELRFLGYPVGRQVTMSTELP
jgi:hypothetical protein